MEENKVSIVVPVYNISKYIDKCVKSILSQTYANFELLLIDDGSSDGSDKLCDAYAQEDERIFVYHQKNSGVSTARNLGLQRSTGMFVMFVDGDDWLEINAVEMLIDALKSSDADVCFCNKYYINESDIKSATKLEAAKSYTAKEILHLHLKAKFISAPWLSIAKNNKLCFFDSTIHVMEDWEYNFRLLCNSHNVLILDKPYYHYRLNLASVSKAKVSRRKLTCLQIPDKVNTYLRDNNSSLLEEARYVPVFLIYMLLTNIALYGYESPDILVILKIKAKEQLKYVWTSKVSSFNNKITISLASISPTLFTFLFRIKYAKK